MLSTSYTSPSPVLPPCSHLWVKAVSLGTLSVIADLGSRNEIKEEIGCISIWEISLKLNTYITQESMMLSSIRKLLHTHIYCLKNKHINTAVHLSICLSIYLSIHLSIYICLLLRLSHCCLFSFFYLLFCVFTSFLDYSAW